GNGGGVGLQAGAKASIDGSDLDSHEASSGSRASHDARHDIDARATQDFKEASDYFTSRKVSESGSHTDNNADSRVDQLGNGGGVGLQAGAKASIDGSDLDSHE
ncbi:hypothetical protein, partial [Citrobacter freundii]